VGFHLPTDFGAVKAGVNVALPSIHSIAQGRQLVFFDRLAKREIGFACVNTELDEDFWLEFRDTSVRTEQDVLAILELPVLSQVPWVGVEPEEKNENGKYKPKKKSSEEKKETVEV